MKILALYPYIHLSSSALLVGGEIVAASPEERFDRQKMSTAFPNKSAAWCLKSQGLKWEDLDMIVVPWNPMRNVNHASRRWVSEMNWRGQLLSHVPIQVMRAIDGPFENEMEIRWGKTRIVYMNHHECHAANGFFLSPFEEADILTIDGHGEDETCFFGSGKGNTITQRSNVIYPHSVGLFYGTFTDFLGFTPDVDEWKVMALSSFSQKKNEYDDKIRSLITLTDQGFELNLTYFDYFNFDRRPHFYHQKLIDLIGPPRKKDEPFTERHYAIAGAMQRVFVETVTHLLKVTKKNGSQSDNIVISGGAAMNSVYNGILDKLDIYKNSSISSCPDDSGVAIGAALLAWHRYGKKPRKVQEQQHNYWGPAYSDEEIRDTLKKFKISFDEPKDLIPKIAAELANGKLIGWFQGAMEFGHRALGNRSILADPRKESTKNVVNAAVKYRESFRPFAPAVMAEKAEEIFDLRPGRKVRFMERVVPILPDWADQLGAVNHVDGTGRVQTVERELNPKFYDLINEFGKITGVPVLLNTSYNLNGEPIVMTPEHAIRTFFSCGLDILVLGPCVVRK
ncbi:MAG: carbamoyltransferase family protein [Bacteroidota bacterium]